VTFGGPFIALPPGFSSCKAALNNMCGVCFQNNKIRLPLYNVRRTFIHKLVERCYLESTGCLNEVSVRVLYCRTTLADADTRGKQRALVAV